MRSQFGFVQGALRKLIDNSLGTLEGEPTQQEGRVPSGNVNPLSAICDVAESLIAMVEPRHRPLRADPVIQLEGNFAPVDENPPQAVLQVSGSIPTCLLGGAYIRNGGNPLHMPTGGYHFFDGDGMLHVLMFNDGEAVTHCCRYTKTSRCPNPLHARAHTQTDRQRVLDDEMLHPLDIA